MPNNRTLGIIVVLAVVLGGIYFALNKNVDESTSGSNTKEGAALEIPNTTKGGTVAPKTSNPASNTSVPTGANGRVVFSITDAAVNMNTLSEINMKLNKLEVHGSAGWVTVLNTPTTYDLLRLNNIHKSKLLTDVELKTGTYDQIRLSVASIVVKTKSGAERTARLPSSELKINTKLLVSTGKISSMNLDFLADKSLHVTGSGEYIFAPVVKIEAKSGASVNVDSDYTVVVIGGQTDNSSIVGMDIDGSLKVNFQIDASQDLDVEGNKIIIEGILN